MSVGRKRQRAIVRQFTRHLVALSVLLSVLVLAACQMVVVPTPQPEAAAPSAAEDKIASAMSAAPMAIAMNATVKDWPAEPGGEAKELRAGSNGWLCRPDDPATPGNDPRCLDANWLKLFGTPFGPDREAYPVPGVAYMLQGDSVADNDDPNAKTPPAGKEWQNGAPHIMIASPKSLDPALFSKEMDSGGPWLTFGGTPREHLMVPVQEGSH